MTVRVACLLFSMMLFASIVLRTKKSFAFSLEDYEGGVQLGDWRGTLEGAYLFEDQDSKSAGSSLTLTRSRTDELASVANDGFYLIDPRLLMGSAGLNLDFFQEQDRVSHAPGLYTDGLLWGYNFNSSLFPQWPENASVFANQSQSVSDTTFGGRTQSNNSSYGLIGQLLEDSILKDHGLYYFSSRLSLREENFDETTTQLGEKYELDQQREIVDYTAEKGFETADLRFRYQFDNERDTGTSHLDFQTQEFGIDYSQDFGPTLNRTWDSNVFYYSRDGTGGLQENLFVNQTLDIHHYENLSSSSQYQFQYNNVGDLGATTYQLAQFILRHRWYANFTQMLDLAATRQTLPNGDIASYWIGGSNSYSHWLPWHGTFFLNTSGQYEFQDNSLSSSRIQVTDEPHTAPINDTPFTLNNTFVITETIVVVDTRGGSRLPCELNVDYVVLQLGNQTQLKRVPTSFVIQPGDPLQVSYTYQVPANARFSTTTKNITIGMNFPLIDWSYAYESIEQTLLSGEGAQFLQHMRSNTFSLGIHQDWTRITTRANAMYQTVDSSNVSFNMTDLSQNISYHPGWDILLSITGDETLTDYTAPIHRTRSYAFQFDGDRPLGNEGSAAIFASLRNLEDSEFPTQKELEGGLRVRFILGKLQIAPTLSWYDRTWGAVESRDLRIEIRVSRLFY